MYVCERVTELNRERRQRNTNLGSVNVERSIENVVSVWGLSVAQADGIWEMAFQREAKAWHQKVSMQLWEDG